jgi:hypothetical protein
MCLDQFKVFFRYFSLCFLFYLDHIFMISHSISSTKYGMQDECLPSMHHFVCVKSVNPLLFAGGIFEGKRRLYCASLKAGSGLSRERQLSSILFINLRDGILPCLPFLSECNTPRCVLFNSLCHFYHNLNLAQSIVSGASGSG